MTRTAAAAEERSRRRKKKEVDERNEALVRTCASVTTQSYDLIVKIVVLH
jgi:hypothetical protein